jgi:hypothetical protein
LLKPGQPLEGFAWSVEELERRRKGDPQKVRIAARLRRETTMTLTCADPFADERAAARAVALDEVKPAVITAADEWAGYPLGAPGGHFGDPGCHQVALQFFLDLVCIWLLAGRCRSNEAGWLV